MAGHDEDRKDAAESSDVVALEDVRRGLGELVGQVSYGGVRLAITKHGRPVAALVPFRDLERLQALDLAAAP